MDSKGQSMSHQYFIRIHLRITRGLHRVDDFTWDQRVGGIMFSGDTPIDMGHAEIGDEVRLRANGNEFDVVVEIETDGVEFSGTVVRIGPRPCTEAEGVQRGDQVSFSEAHIFQIKRA